MIHSSVDFSVDTKKLENVQTDKKTLEIQLADFQYYNYICCSYYQLKWVEKLHFIECLVKNIQSIGSLSILLNTLHSSLHRMGKYMYSSIGNIFDFDKPLMDHNRMFQDNLVPKIQIKNVEWFKTLNEKIQESLIISLLRTAGGGITFHTYKVLEKEYEFRLSKLKQDLNPKPAEEATSDERSHITFEDNPLNKKCEQLHKEYTAMIMAYKTEIFGKSTSNEKSSKKKNKKKNPQSKTKTKKPKKSKHEEDSDHSMTRIELMPMWAVKKIFSYLDTKTLTIAKKVNSYWKYAIDELIKEQKTRHFISQTIAKLSSEIDYSYVNAETQIKTPKQSKKGFHENKMAELKERGAILEELRCDKSVPMEQYSVFLDVLKEIRIRNAQPFKFSTVHPRATKTNERCFNEPNILYKDVNLIVSNTDDDVLTQKISSFYVPKKSTMETPGASSSSCKKSSPSSHTSV